MNRTIIIFSSLIFAILNFTCNDATKSLDRNIVIIDIQPFADFPNEMTRKISNQIKEIYPYINIKSEIALPASSYYSPRNRYRADTLIAFLKRLTPPGHITIGLTSKDISSSKGQIKDWGVMGLGFKPGTACVVSSFRLKKEKLSSQLYKVSIHELGHTAGLKHCPEKTCFMRDAEGGNPTDEEKEFCQRCRKYLAKKGWNINKVISS